MFIPPQGYTSLDRAVHIVCCINRVGMTKLCQWNAAKSDGSEGIGKVTLLLDLNNDLKTV